MLNLTKTTKMDRNGNVYTFLYASVMVIIVATVLSVAATNLKPFQDKNSEIEKKQNILASVNIEATALDAEEIYADKIVNTYVINSVGEEVDAVAFDVDLKKERAKDLEERALPVYECQIDGDIKYILPMYGTGLWGPIWGYISVNSDMNTIYGATFDHEGETPGLGAEIASTPFQEQFPGKTIFDADGSFASIIVAKAGEVAPAEHSVDGISGGTITSKALQEMLLEDLGAYNAFFNQKK